MTRPPEVAMQRGIAWAARIATVILAAALPAAAQQPTPPKRPEPLPIKIKLPFPAGEEYRILQGNHGKFSHFGPDEYAWDFDMPEGSPVSACAAGRVVDVRAESDVSGDDPSFKHDANVVIVDHGGALFSAYVHLKVNSVRVKTGETVKAGQVLGLSGKTGFATRPHLHFKIFDHLYRSHPVRFVDFKARNGIPEEGDVCVSGRPTAEVDRFAGDSVMPADTFAPNGIVLSSKFPARLFRDGESYEIAGEAKRPARDAALFIMPRLGGRALASYFAPVDARGRFRMTITVRKPDESWEKNPQAYALAMALVTADGSYKSDYSVAIVIHK
jgi:murein DD-endopeptidase MepM/ murein hydrolase activator NlpD